VAPRDADVALAKDVARKVADLSRGSVKRVIMIGSRARGTPRSDSDLDLVVLVEILAKAAPWGPAEFSSTAGWLRSAVGPLRVPLDLWVRTTDRYAEAMTVPGGVEHSAADAGVVVYDAPLGRPPIVRTSPENVRREHVSAWIHHSLLAAEALRAPEQPESEIVRAVVERLTTAVLVHHRIAPEPLADTVEHAKRLPRPAAELVTVLEREVDGGIPALDRALRATRRVLTYLERDSLQAKTLRKAEQRLSGLERERALDGST
jgi:hypothetical protein